MTDDRLWIGIDPGTKCGYAALDTNGHLLVSGTWNLAGARHEGAGMRYLKARRSLTELLLSFPGRPLALGYEEVRHHAGTTAAHVYGGIVSQIQVVCEELGVPYLGIPVATIKRASGGGGAAKKEYMMRAARDRWGLARVEEDEADALFTAWALIGEIG